MYAIFHSSLLLVLTLFTIDLFSPNTHGMFGGMWVDGQFIFTMLVLLANVKILISSFLISGWALFFVLGSVIFFFINFWAISALFPENDDFGALQNMVTFPQTYLFFFFFCSGYGIYQRFFLVASLYLLIFQKSM